MPGKRWVIHVPPKLAFASSTAKLVPGHCLVRWYAAPTPEMPAPTISTSKWGAAAVVMGLILAPAAARGQAAFPPPVRPATLGPRRAPHPRRPADARDADHRMGPAASAPRLPDPRAHRRAGAGARRVRGRLPQRRPHLGRLLR